MSDTPDQAPARSGRDEDDVREEVRLDLDEERLDTWADVRDDYAVDPDSEVSRPALTEREEGRGIDDAVPPDEPEDVT